MQLTRLFLHLKENQYLICAPLITILLLTIYVSEVKLIQIIDKVNCGITITNSYQGVNVKSQIITKTIMSVATKDNIKQ